MGTRKGLQEGIHRDGDARAVDAEVVVPRALADVAGAGDCVGRNRGDEGAWQDFDVGVLLDKRIGAPLNFGEESRLDS